MNIFWTSTMFKLLFLAVLPAHVRAYQILMIPIPAKSHVFGMAAMTVYLANRGHNVTFFVGENYRLNLPELRNRTQISVVRYKDTADYDANDENHAKAAIESGGDVKQQVSIMRTMYEGLRAYTHIHCATFLAALTMRAIVTGLQSPTAAAGRILSPDALE